MNIFQILTPKDSTAYMKDTMTIPEAMDQFRTCGYSSVPVIREDGTYAGVVSEGDFLWTYIDGKDCDETGKPNTIAPILHLTRGEPVKIDRPILDVIQMAMDQNFVPILDDRDMYIGIVTRKSIIEYLRKKLLEV